MQDEIYVKKILLYHGETLFSRAADDSQSLTKSVLGVICCIFAGPIFTLIIAHCKVEFAISI